MHHFPHLLKFDQITRHEKATAQNLIAFKCSTWPFIIVLKGEISYNDLTATMRTKKKIYRRRFRESRNKSKIFHTQSEGLHIHFCPPHRAFRDCSCSGKSEETLNISRTCSRAARKSAIFTNWRNCKWW